ncbi:Hypothetical predicted protein [Paramuricea clavata]|uniref:Uncharacterized protein n=1 Tax=Paramuricea clavata TaxID=317549 RepID=A0A7D9K1Q2_PARCT|nr:Hypothetical predicted protein [Paramuricea clavata]
MWWLLTQYFGLRGRQEHHGMKVEDFTIGKDNDGLEHVEYIERPTKTRNGSLSKKSTDFLPKMYATGDERCPVALFLDRESNWSPQLAIARRLYDGDEQEQQQMSSRISWRNSPQRWGMHFKPGKSGNATTASLSC